MAQRLLGRLADMQPATEPASRPAPDVSMMLASIRLPVVIVEQLDHLASSQGVRRSDVIREALFTYVAEKTAPLVETKPSAPWTCSSGRR